MTSVATCAHCGGEYHIYEEPQPDGTMLWSGWCPNCGRGYLPSLRLRNPKETGGMWIKAVGRERGVPYDHTFFREDDDEVEAVLSELKVGGFHGEVNVMTRDRDLIKRLVL